MQPTQIQTTSTPQQDWHDVQHQERMQRRIERREHYQAAGVPVWGVLLILIGAIALLGNFGIGLGWLFGLALGAWLVYLGVRHVSEGGQINWWLVGLGLLIGLGSISSGLVDQLVFPIVLIIVGLGIVGQQYLSRQDQ
jgi:hypothetical protein